MLFVSTEHSLARTCFISTSQKVTPSIEISPNYTPYFRIIYGCPANFAVSACVEENANFGLGSGFFEGGPTILQIEHTQNENKR